MHPSRKHLTLLTTLLLSACAVGPNFHSPAAPTTKSYIKSTAPTQTINAEGKTQYFVNGQDLPAQWWELFHSSALNDLIQQGLKNSPNLAAGQAALQEAQETFNSQEGALLIPSVTGTVGAQRQRNPGAAAGLPKTPASLYNLFNTALNVSYTLDIFGANRRELESLAAQADYARYELAGTQITLASNIATTVISIASLQDQIKTTQQLIQAQQAQLTITQKQFHLGGVSQVNLLSQQTQLAQTQASLPPLEKSLAQSQHALAVLVGQLPSEAQLPHIQLSELQLPTNIPVSLPSSLVQQRPDIQASEALLHSASAQVGVATANMLPQITLSGSYGSVADSPGALFSSATNAWSFGGQLLQPILNGGALRSKKKAAVAAYDQAAAQYQQTVLQAFQNVADTLRALQTDAETLQAAQQAESASRKAWLIAQRQYKLGGVSYLSLLTTEQQYQQASITRIQAEAARLSDTATLFQALGGGWKK